MSGETCNRSHTTAEPCSDPACYCIAPMEFGARVKALRRKAGLSQRQVAERMTRLLACGRRHHNVKAQHVGAYELGLNVPGLERAAALADVLGVPLDALTGRQMHQGRRYPLPPGKAAP